MKKAYFIYFVILCFVILNSCNHQNQKEEKKVLQFEAMNTFVTLQGWTENEKALEQAKLIIENLDKKISVTNKDSQIFLMNEYSLLADREKNQNEVVCEIFDDEVISLLGRALEFAKITRGAFNPCLYPITKAWGFTKEQYTVPSENEIALFLKKTDYEKMAVGKNGKVEFESGMLVDFGGIAKGYAGDVAILKLKECGVEAGLLDLGGNIQVFGQKKDGTKWKIGIKNPIAEGILGGLEIEEGAVITSGGYERFFTADDGKKYIHIMDNKTGYPVDNGLVSVTIISKKGEAADALSTALFVMGKENAIEFWRDKRGRECDDFDFILIEQTGERDLEIFVSAGVAKDFFVLDCGANVRVEEVERKD